MLDKKAVLPHEAKSFIEEMFNDLQDPERVKLHLESLVKPHKIGKFYRLGEPIEAKKLYIKVPKVKPPITFGSFREYEYFLPPDLQEEFDILSKIGKIGERVSVRSQFIQNIIHCDHINGPKNEAITFGIRLKKRMEKIESEANGAFYIVVVRAPNGAGDRAFYTIVGVDNLTLQLLQYTQLDIKGFLERMYGETRNKWGRIKELVRRAHELPSL